VNAYTSVKQQVRKLRRDEGLARSLNLTARATDVWTRARNQDASALLLLNSLALILARVMSSGLGFFTWLLVARLYAQSEVGLASGIVSAMMLCVQVALLGIGSAFIKLYPRYEDHPTELLHTSFSVVTVASLVGAGVFLLVASSAFHELSLVGSSPSYMLVFFGLTLFGTLNVLMDNMSIVLRRGHQVLARNVLFGLTTIIIAAVMPLVFDTKSSMAILLAWVLGGLAACTMGVVQLWLSVSGYVYVPRLDLDITNRLFRIGMPNYALTITERAPAWIMPIVVTELLSPTDNAHWYTVWMMAWVVLIIPISVGQNLFAEASRHPETLEKTLRQSIRSSLTIGSIAMIGAIIGAPLVLHLLGADYAHAGTAPLRILALSVWPITFIQVYYAVCRALHRLQEASLVGLLNAGVSTAAAAAAGVAYGLTGMAAAWLALQFVTAAWILWRMPRLIRKMIVE
jgi:O-antigen/teichoic acid export membrane protein